MLFQEIDSHIENFEFDFAQSKLLAIINDNDQDDQIILKAYQKLIHLNHGENQLNEIYLFDFIKFLFDKKLFSELVNLYEKFNLKNVQFEIQKKYLQSLWQIGNIKKSKITAKEMLLEILTHKRWNLFAEFKEITKDFNSDIAFAIADIHHALDINDFFGLKNILEQFYEKYIWADASNALENIQRILNIFEDYECQDTISYQAKLRLQCLTNLLNGSELTSKQLIELLLLSSEEIDFMLLMYVFEDHAVEQYLKKKNFKLPRKMKNLGLNKKNKVSKKTNIKIERILNESYSLSNIDLRLEDQSNAYEMNLNDSIKQETEFEKNIWLELRNEKITLEEKLEHIKALLMMDLNHVAKRMLKDIEENEEVLYLLSEVSLRLNDFSSVIYYANEAIDKFKIEGDKANPFYYLKAKAYEYSNKPADAQKMYRFISQTDPEFMDAKRKI